MDSMDKRSEEESDGNEERAQRAWVFPHEVPIIPP